MIQKCIFLNKGGTFLPHKQTKRSALLAVATFFIALCLTTFTTQAQGPNSALPINISTVNAGYGNYYTFAGNVLTITGTSASGSYYRITGSVGTYTYVNETTVGFPAYGQRIGATANTTSARRIVVAGGLGDVYITLDNVSIVSTGCAFSIGAGTIVHLTILGENVLVSGGSTAGLNVPQGATVIIDGYQSENDHQLTVQGSNGGGSGAGIGGNGVAGNGQASGTITINSGTIVARGGQQTGSNTGSGAGIGGGGGSGANSYGGNVEGTITINGGIVTATGGYSPGGSGSGGGSGAGIGGGGGGHQNQTHGGSNNGGIYVYNAGTTVIAQGGSSGRGTGGAGIGGGGGFESGNGGTLGNDWWLDPDADVITNGGTGTNGDGPGVGNGGQAGSGAQTIINITHPAPVTNVLENFIQARLTVNAQMERYGGPTYQWYQREGSTETLITGATSRFFDIPTDLVESGSPYFYFCRISGPSAPSVDTNEGMVVVSNVQNRKILLEYNNQPIGQEISFTPKPYTFVEAQTIIVTIRNDGNYPFSLLHSSLLTVEITDQQKDEVAYPAGFLAGTNGVYAQPSDVIVGGSGTFRLQTKNGAELGGELAVGTYTATVLVKDGSTTLGSFDIEFTVTEKQIKRIEYVTPPSNLTYKQNIDPLDLTGLTIRLIHYLDDGEDDPVQPVINRYQFAANGLSAVPAHGFVFTDLYYDDSPITINVTGSPLLTITTGSDVLTIKPTGSVTIVNGTITGGDYDGQSTGYYEIDENVIINFTSEDRRNAEEWFSHWTHNYADGQQIGFIDNTVTSDGYGKGEVKMLLGGTITVTANFKPLYVVDYSVDGSNGSIDWTDGVVTNSSGERVIDGEDVTFEATPDAGYTVREWKVDGKPELTQWGGTTFTVDGGEVDGPLNVTVSFRNRQTIYVTFVIGKAPWTDIVGVPYEINDTIQVPVPYPTDDYEYIEGWYYTYGGLPKKWNFDVGQQIHESVIDQADLDLGLFTLTANWEPKTPGTHIVTFIAEGGTPNMFVQFIEDGGYLEPPIPYPVRAGYYLDNAYAWSENPNDDPLSPSLAFYNFTAPQPVEKDMTLYAIWIEKDDPDDVVVNYISSDGRPTFQSIVIRKGDTAPFPDNSVISMPVYLLPDTENTKYVYTWREYDPNTGDYSEDEYNFALPVEKDLYLYAEWQPIALDEVVYILVALGEETQTTYRYFAKRNQSFFEGVTNDVPNSLPDVLLSGYVLKGWYPEPCLDDGDDKWCDCRSLQWIFSEPFPNVYPSDVITQVLYAGWEPVEPTDVAVYFYSPDADNITFQLVVTKIYTPVDFSELEDVERDGYALTGWYTTEAGAAVNNPLDFWPVTRDVDPGVERSMRLYAGWEERETGKYFVTFKTNLGEPAFMPIQQVAENGYAKLPLPAPTRDDGYVLKGWYKGLSADCEDGGCNDDDDLWKFTEDEVTDDIVLWAGWQAVTPGDVVITFIARGAEPAYAVRTIPGGSVFNLYDAPVPEMDGFLLKGWSTTDSESNDRPLYLFTTAINANLTVYAVWEELPTDIDYNYIVTFMANGGDPPISYQYIKIGDKATFERPFKSGQYLLSWHKDTPTGTVWDFNNLVADDMTLYAEWEDERWGMELSAVELVDDEIDFGSEEYGYVWSPVTITITNTGNQETYDLEVSLDPDDDSFILGDEVVFEEGKLWIKSIPEGETFDFTIVPAEGLDVGVYTASVSLINGRLAEAFTVTVEVTQKPISITALETVTTPRAGFVDETDIVGTGYTGAIVWTPTLLTGNIFDENKTYTAAITLSADGNHTFSGSYAGVTVNGKTIASPSIINSGATLSFSVTFDATDARVQTDDIAGISSPVATETPSASITATTEYSGSEILWYLEDDGTVFNGTAFDYDTEYSVRFKLSANSGYTFFGYAVDDAGFTVDGVAATIEEVADDYTYIMLYTVFPPTRKELTESLLEFAPTEVTYNGLSQAVTVSAKTGVTGVGAITVYYESLTYAKSTTAPTNAGTYIITVDVAQGSVYAPATIEFTEPYTIKPKTLTVTGFNISKDYDGTTAIDAVSGFGSLSFVGLVSPETAVVSPPLTTTATYQSRNAGTDIGINFTGAAIFTIGTGTANSNNYTVLTPANGEITGTILKINAVGEPGEIPAVTDLHYEYEFDMFELIPSPTLIATYDYNNVTFAPVISDNTDGVIETGTLDVDADGRTLRFWVNDLPTVGLEATITVTVSTPNYNDFDVVITVTMVQKEIVNIAITMYDDAAHQNVSTTFAYDGYDKGIYYSYIVTKLKDGLEIDLDLDPDIDETDIEIIYSSRGTTQPLIGDEIPSEAGQYQLMLRVSRDNEVYTGNGTINFRINPINPEYEDTKPTELTATYGDLLSTVILPTAGNGVWTWDEVDGDPTTTVGPAGTQTHNATFTPDDTRNYNTISDIEIDIEVSKKDPNLEAEDLEIYFVDARSFDLDGYAERDVDTTYDGGDITYVIVEAGLTGATITGTNFEYTAPGVVTIKASSAESDNYLSAEVTFELTISMDPAGEFAAVYFMVEGSLYHNDVVIKGEPVAEPTEPDVTGKIFKGWLKENTDIKWVFSNPVEADMTLEAELEDEDTTIEYPVTVEFYVDGGLYDRQVVETGASVTEPDEPQAVGKIFKGWFIEGTPTKWVFSNPVNEDMRLDADLEDEDTTLGDPVTVIFMANGSLYDKQIVERYDPVEEPAEEPEVDGKIFKGWLNGTVKWVFSNPVEANMTLEADLEDEDTSITDPVTVNFYVDGSFYNRQIVQRGEPVDEPAEPEVVGKIFKGWLNGTLKWVFSNPVEDDMRLDADLEDVDTSIEHPVTVEFYIYAGGSLYNRQVVEKGETVDEPAEPEVVGKIFKGWLNGTLKWVFSNPVEDDMTLIADLEDEDTSITDPVTVNFYVDGSFYNRQIVQRGEPVDEPAEPEVVGKIFKGWLNGTLKWVFSNPVEVDMRLDADLEDEDTSITDPVTVNFYVDGSFYNRQIVQRGEPVDEPAEPEVVGKIFKGWLNGTLKWVFGNPVEDDMRLDADLEDEDTSIDDPVTVDFYVDGSFYNRQIVQRGETVDEPAEPDVFGKIFKGWLNGTVKWVFINPVEDDMRLDADLEDEGTFPNKVTVEFYVAGTLYNRQELKKGDLAIEPAEPQVVDKIFRGWLVEGTDVKWVFSNPVEADMTLIAELDDEDEFEDMVTVIFYADGGLYDQQRVERFTTLVEPAEPQVTGKIFKGWLVDGSGIKWVFTNVVEDDMNLIADLEDEDVMTDPVTVSFYADGSLYDRQRVERFDPVTKPALDPIHPEGKTFDSWYTSQGVLWLFADGVPADMDLFAQWYDPATDAKVTFDSRGGTPSQIVKIVTKGQKVEKPEPNPELLNNEFTGWYKTDDNFTVGNLWQFSNDNVPGDMTLYAGWEPKSATQFTVVFDGNGGIPEERIMVVNPGDILVEPDKPVHLLGQVFTGWYTDKTYQTQWDFSKAVTGDLRLYAGWVEPQENMFVVVFYGNGGTPDNKIEYVDANKPIPASVVPVVTNEGYVFIGWYIERACETLWTFTENVTDNLFLYAGWTEEKPNQFAVIFDANGGTPNNTLEFVDENTPIPAAIVPDVSFAGHVFIGWYIEPTCETLWNFNDNVTGHLFLYAGWAEEKPNQFAVIFDANGGTPNNKLIFVDENKPIPEELVPDVAKSGFIFTGWYIEPACKNLWNFNDNVIEHTFLYAGWAEEKPNQLLVIFDANGGIPNNTWIYVDEGTPIPPAKMPAVSKSGFGFTQWYKEPACVTPWYMNENVTKNPTFLYAGWEVRPPNHFAVTFVLNDGTPDQLLVWVPANTPVEKPETPVRDGYLFTDWYTEMAYENLWDFAANVTGDMSLYAHWGPEDYNVFVVIDGGAPTLLGRFKEGETIDISAGVAPPNKRFDKWEANPNVVFASSTGSTKATTSFRMPASDVTVTAIFMEALDFDTYAVTKWNNTFMLNMTKLKAAGYDVATCNWYKNGVLIHTGLSYYSKDSQLELNVPYYFELTMSNQSKKYSTDKVLTAYKSLELIAYPNPVVSGNMLTVEGVEEGSLIEVFNQIGTCVYNTIAAGNPVTFTLNVPAGLYIIRTTNGEIKVIINN